QQFRHSFCAKHWEISASVKKLAVIQELSAFRSLYSIDFHYGRTQSNVGNGNTEAKQNSSSG
ncbi:MAG: hypothetical protein ACHQKY_10850, partial [Terriglobia bacterium]